MNATDKSTSSQRDNSAATAFRDVQDQPAWALQRQTTPKTSLIIAQVALQLGPKSASYKEL